MASSREFTRATPAFHLPIDVTIEILSRLPVKSLLRFKSVCKNWYALIQSPNFISKHQTQSTLNPNLSFSSLLVVTTYTRGTSYCGMSLHFNDACDGPINLDFPFLNRRDYISIVGFCDGLVCLSLSEVRFALILCNPATGQFREIPDWEWEDDFSLFLESAWSVHFRMASYGFGFDPSANDYKLIRILYAECLDEGMVVRADVYVMSTGTWREIDNSKLSMFYGEDDEVLVIDETSASAVLNGVLYWGPCVSPMSEMSEVIVVSFDMGDEVFRNIRTPRCLDAVWYGSKVGNWRVMQMKDKLALLVFYPEDGCFDVWVLHENKVSWTKQFIVGPFSRIESPVGCGENGQITVVGCGKNGELVVTDHKESGDMKLFLYDPKSRKTKNLRFGQVPYWSCICLYTETLLPVKEKMTSCLTRRKR